VRHLRAFVTTVVLAAVLALGLTPAAAQAAGPGATVYFNTIPGPVDVPGAQFSGGMTIRQLIANNGVDPASVTFVNVTRPDGGQVALTQGDLGAVIIDNGTTTRFVRGATTITATADTGPLQISVNGGDMVVVASVDRSTIEEGQSVSLSSLRKGLNRPAILSIDRDVTPIFGGCPACPMSTSPLVSFRRASPCAGRAGRPGAARRSASASTTSTSPSATACPKSSRRPARRARQAPAAAREAGPAAARAAAARAPAAAPIPRAPRSPSRR